MSPVLLTWYYRTHMIQRVLPLYIHITEQHALTSPNKYSFSVWRQMSLDRFLCSKNSKYKGRFHQLKGKKEHGETQSKGSSVSTSQNSNKDTGKTQFAQEPFKTEKVQNMNKNYTQNLMPALSYLGKLFFYYTKLWRIYGQNF